MSSYSIEAPARIPASAELGSIERWRFLAALSRMKQGERRVLAATVLATLSLGTLMIVGLHAAIPDNVIRMSW